MNLPDCGADPMQRAARRQGYLSVTDGVSSKGDLPPPLRFALLPEPPLARPRLALVRAADARCYLLIGGQSQLIRFPLADLVAQAPGFLELQLGGGVAHLLFEVLDVRAQIMPDHVRGLVFADEIGRAACRERVCTYVESSVVAV